MFPKHPKDIESVYLIAIAGTGMTALAGLLKSVGYRVSGSDQGLYPPMSTFLEEMQIPVHAGFHEDHLDPPPDLVIIGNAMSRGNPEVEAVLERKLLYTSLPMALKELFIRGNYSCVVAGTHGKTTSSSLLAWILEHAGRDPGFFIGGIPENFGRGFKLGGGNLFVLEGDEYDSAFFDKGSKFLHYLPDLVLLNNIEFDHADIFRSLDDIKTAFRRLITLIPRTGYLVACWDDPVVREVSAPTLSRLITFGLGGDADWQARNLTFDETGSQFEVWHRGTKVGRFSVPLCGTHMVQNTLGVMAACHALGIDFDTIQSGLTTFKNVRRRLQKVADVDGIAIFDDFAHHPSEVRATLHGMRQRFPNRRIWAIYEPRTATSKRRVFEEAYVEAFAEAHRVVLTPLDRPEKVPEDERLTIEKLRQRLHRQDRPAWIVSPDDEMLRLLISRLEPGDIALFMSNGDFHQMPQKLSRNLEQTRKP